MSETHRRLPHIYPKGKWLFVTWHLSGSLPFNRYPPPGLRAGQAFVWMDRYLDTTRTGPLYWAREDIASIILRSLQRGVELGQYDLRAWVIMANHVHVLLLPKVAPQNLLRAIKGVTAREANLLLDRTGQPFWQSESYDHWVRDEPEFEKIVAYIENNPVKAGLVAAPESYPWSSAHVAQALLPAATALLPSQNPSVAVPASDGKSAIAAGMRARATPTSAKLLHTPRA